MTEENEVVQEQQAPVQEEQSAQRIEEQPLEQEKAASEAEINWQKANQVLQSQRHEIEELRQKLNQMAQPKKEEEPDEFAALDQDDYLTVGKARALAEKLAEKKAADAARKIVNEYAQQQAVTSDETRCRSKYEDYDFVIENYAIPMIKNDPALAYKIQQSKNPAETAYKLGKLSDSYEDSMTKQQTSPRAEKVLKNTSRPVSGAAVSGALKRQAEDYSKMSPHQIWEMSQKYARGA